MQYISAAFAFILILLAIIFLPQLFTSLHAVQVSTVTDSGGITTEVGITTGNLTLSEELYRAVISSVVSLESTNSNDVPFSVSYDEDTHVLGVGGLEGNATRVLSAEYEYLSPENNSNIGAVATFLGIVICMCLIVLLVVIPGGTVASVWSRFR